MFNVFPSIIRRFSWYFNSTFFIPPIIKDLTRSRWKRLKSSNQAKSLTGKRWWKSKSVRPESTSYMQGEPCHEIVNLALSIKVDNSPSLQHRRCQSNVHRCQEFEHDWFGLRLDRNWTGPPLGKCSWRDHGTNTRGSRGWKRTHQRLTVSRIPFILILSGVSPLSIEDISMSLKTREEFKSRLAEGVAIAKKVCLLYREKNKPKSNKTFAP